MRIFKLLLIPFMISILFSCQSEKEKLTVQIKENETRLFNDSTKMLDPGIAIATLNGYEKFIQSFPDDTASPGYLFKAADLAHGMKRSNDAVRLYKEFIVKYPQHTKAAASYFLMAFVYDNDMNKKDSAKIFYKEFLEKFPNHQLAPSAKASLDQIEMGLTDEELVKMFEARLDSANKK